MKIRFAVESEVRAAPIEDAEFEVVKGKELGEWIFQGEGEKVEK